MKKVIVMGILTLVVIGCVLAAGCTSTTSNGEASGYMMPAGEYLGSDLELQLEDNIDILLGEELRYRMGYKQLTEEEFAKAFGTTSPAYVLEILDKKSYSGTMTDAEMEVALQERIAGTQVLIGEKKLGDISRWSNEDLMNVIRVRVAAKDSAIYDSLKAAGTMTELPGMYVIFVVVPGKGILGTTGMGYSAAASGKASYASGTMTDVQTETPQQVTFNIVTLPVKYGTDEPNFYTITADVGSKLSIDIYMWGQLTGNLINFFTTLYYVDNGETKEQVIYTEVPESMGISAGNSLYSSSDRSNALFTNNELIVTADMDGKTFYY